MLFEICGREGYGFDNLLGVVWRGYIFYSLSVQTLTESVAQTNCRVLHLLKDRQVILSSIIKGLRNILRAWVTTILHE
jgi:hypothetical protein